MQTVIERTSIRFQVVKSARNPGCYACEAIDYDNEGIGIVVEFLAHDSKRLAEEYAAWKNFRD